jgi:hypothetical protein
MDIKLGSMLLKQGLESVKCRKDLEMEEKNIIDFKWEIMTKLKEKGQQERQELGESLTRRLSGLKVSVTSFKNLGISLKPVFTAHILVVDYIEVDPEGYGIIITDTSGNKTVPHPVYGIEIFYNDKNEE